MQPNDHDETRRAQAAAAVLADAVAGDVAPTMETAGSQDATEPPPADGGDGVAAAPAAGPDATPSKLSGRAVAALSVAGASLFLLLCFASYGRAESAAARGPSGLGPTVASWFVEPLGAGAHVAALLGLIWGVIAFFQERTPDLVLRGVGTLLLAASTATIVGLSHGGVRTLWAGTIGTFGARTMTDLGTLGQILGWVVFLSLFAVSFVFATDWFFRSLLRSGRRTYDPRALPVEPPRGDLLEDPAKAEPREFIREAARTTPVEAEVAEPVAVARPRIPEVRLSDLPEGFSVEETSDRPIVRGTVGYSGVQFLPASDELADSGGGRRARSERVFVNGPEDDAHDGMSFEPQAELAAHEDDTTTADRDPEPESGIGLADASFLVDEVFAIPSHFVEPEHPHDGGSAVAEIRAALTEDIVVRGTTPTKRVASHSDEVPPDTAHDTDLDATVLATETEHSGDSEPHSSAVPAPIPPVSAPVLPAPPADATEPVEPVEPAMTLARARTEVSPADGPAIHPDAPADESVVAVSAARSMAVAAERAPEPAAFHDDVVFDDVVYVYDESARYEAVAPSVSQAIHEAVAASPAAALARAEEPITAAVEHVAAYVRGELERDREPIQAIEIDEFVHYSPGAVAYDTEFGFTDDALQTAEAAQPARTAVFEDAPRDPPEFTDDPSRMSEALQLVISEPLPFRDGDETDADEADTQETAGVVPADAVVSPASSVAATAPTRTPAVVPVHATTGASVFDTAAVTLARPVVVTMPVAATAPAGPAAAAPAVAAPSVAPAADAPRSGQLGLFAATTCDLSRLHTMELDPMFFDAAAAIVGRGRASAVVLQRALGIGYARGLRILDQMTEAGMLGPDAPGGARDIRYTQAQWDEFAGDL